MKRVLPSGVRRSLLALQVAAAIAVLQGVSAEVAAQPDAMDLRALEVISVGNAARLGPLASLSGPNDWARCVAFQPKGSLLACGSKDASMYFWSLPATQATRIASDHGC